MKVATEEIFDLKKLITSDNFYIDELNVYGNNIFFILNDLDNNSYKPYHITVNGENWNAESLSVSLVDCDVSNINIVAYNDGVMLCYMGTYADSERQFYSMRFDPEGNRITD